MTCITTRKLCEESEIDIKNYFFTVSLQAKQAGGTSAELLPEDRASIMDLLYGLMLPSGNDAAVALAQNLHTIIKQKEQISDEDLNEVASLHSCIDAVNLI